MTNKEVDNSVDVEVLSVHEEKTPVNTNDPPDDVKEFMTESKENQPLEFEIHVANNDVTSGAITISWCLTKNALKYLKEKSDPCVVIITKPIEENGYNKLEQRKVVRIRDLLAYITFSRSGANRIFAFVYSNYNDAKQEFLSKSGRSYSNSIINYDGEDFSYNVGSFRAKPLNVNVPEELFGKKPSQWEQDWVYWLNRDKAIDQCDFRSKRIFAYTLQPIIFVFNMTARFMILLWAAIWLNKGTYEFFINLIHPLRIDLDCVIDACWSDCLFSYDKILKRDGEDFVNKFDTERQYRYNWFTPIGLLVLFGVAKFLMFCQSKITNWYLFFVISICVIGAAIIVGTIIAAICYFQKTQITPITEEEIDLLVCSENKVKSIKDVQNKSIRLRYDDLKNKVCKPFSM